MRNLAFLALLFTSFSIQAKLPAELTCGFSEWGSPEVIFDLKNPKELNSKLAAFLDSDLIEADACTYGVDEVFSPYVMNAKNVIGVCVSITTNGGDGTLVILRDLNKELGSFYAEFKKVLVEEPDQGPGQLLLKCK